jgi:hypothetical protein
MADFQTVAANADRIKHGKGVFSVGGGLGERFSSTAQNFEDVLPWRVLSSVKHGFYIDVGAGDSVTPPLTFNHERE